MTAEQIFTVNFAVVLSVNIVVWSIVNFIVVNVAVLARVLVISVCAGVVTRRNIFFFLLPVFVFFYIIVQSFVKSVPNLDISRYREKSLYDTDLRRFIDEFGIIKESRN
jgi:hypothetical protein